VTNNIFRHREGKIPPEVQRRINAFISMPCAHPDGQETVGCIAGKTSVVFQEAAVLPLWDLGPSRFHRGSGESSQTAYPAGLKNGFVES
jgi:hypothetical protein